MQNKFNQTDDYYLALNQVKKIKGFYIHLIVYICVNVFLISLNLYHENEMINFFRWENFATALFWGIGLTGHGLAIFLPRYIFGAKWEQNKINEIKNKIEKVKWE